MDEEFKKIFSQNNTISDSTIIDKTDLRVDHVCIIRHADIVSENNNSGEALKIVNKYKVKAVSLKEKINKQLDVEKAVQNAIAKKNQNFDKITTLKTLKTYKSIIVKRSKHLESAEQDLKVVSKYLKKAVLIKALNKRILGLKIPITQLECVATFLEHTGLTRLELNELINQDLNRHEFNAGLSRLFFINDVDDGLGHLDIVQDPDEPLDPSYESETIVNLSYKKLDRIYRFVNLARKMDWSFADLDWILRSFAKPFQPESCLHFDGINDYVSCENINVEFINDSFTVEAWVKPDHLQINPILAKGLVDNKVTNIDFIFLLDEQGKLAVVDQSNLNSITENTPNYLRSTHSIPMGEFSHVAVSFCRSENDHLSEIKFYINGKHSPCEANISDSDKSVVHFNPSVIGTTLEIGRAFTDKSFAGIIKDVRIWNDVCSSPSIEDNRYKRYTGYEHQLVGYWPLVESSSGEMLDYSLSVNHATLGGGTLSSQPSWNKADLVLDTLPQLQGCVFNGIDQFFVGKDISGFEP